MRTDYRPWDIPDVLVRRDSLCRVSWPLSPGSWAGGGFILRVKELSSLAQRPLSLNPPGITVGTELEHDGVGRVHHGRMYTGRLGGSLPRVYREAYPPRYTGRHTTRVYRSTTSVYGSTTSVYGGTHQGIRRYTPGYTAVHTCGESLLVSLGREEKPLRKEPLFLPRKRGNLCEERPPFSLLMLKSGPGPRSGPLLL